MPEPSVVVDVWTVGRVSRVSRAGLGAVGDVLSDAERERAAALPGGRSTGFVLGRVLLRTALAPRLGCPPREVVLDATCPTCGRGHGQVTARPPDVADASPTQVTHVSVTRSGPVVAVALCDDGPVGVDAESRAAVAAAPLADVAMSPRELEALPARGRTRAITRAWVRKEATLKALGAGLRTAPSDLDLTRPPRGLRGVDAVACGTVAIADLRLGRGAGAGAAAVAVASPVLLPGRSDAPGPPRRLVVRRHDGASLLVPGSS